MRVALSGIMTEDEKTAAINSSPNLAPWRSTIKYNWESSKTSRIKQANLTAPDPAGEGNQVSCCWKFLPFVDAATRSANSIVNQLGSLPAERDDKKHIEILIASGDQYFRHNGLESI